jgi:hypothetical protein
MDTDVWTCLGYQTLQSSMFSSIHSDVGLVRMLPIFDLICEENVVRR